MPFDLQELAATDSEDVLAFWRDMPGVGLSDFDTPAGLTAYIERNPGLSLIARDGDRIVGAMLCGHDGRRGCLHHLAVDPAFRRRGIGRALVERCLAQLAALGLQKCNIFVFADNDDGRDFWIQSGWLIRDDLKILQRSLPTGN